MRLRGDPLAGATRSPAEKLVCLRARPFSSLTLFFFFSRRSEKDTAILGSVRVTLQAPEEKVPCADEPCPRGHVTRKVATDLPYCLNSCSDDGAGDCTGDFDQDKLLCPAVYSNAAFVQYPSLEGQGAVFLTTRVDVVEQQVGPQDSTNNPCVQQDTEPAHGGRPTDFAITRSTLPECFEWSDKQTYSFYISQIEDYLVKIDHSMLAPNVAKAKTGYSMDKGEMLAHLVEGDCDEKKEDCEVQGLKDDDPRTIDPCDDFEPYSSCPTPAVADKWGVNVGDKKFTDVMKVKTLLRAAGLSPDALDSTGEDSSMEASGHPWRLRHKGIVLILQIDYDNTWHSDWGLYPNTDMYRYRYSVINVPDEGYKVTELHDYDQSEGTRTIYYRHGIRIVLRQTGTIGAFSFASALTTCTTSLGLFAVATVIVDLIMQYAKRFAEYEKQRLLETEKFSEKTLKDGLLGVKSSMGNMARKSRGGGGSGGSDMNIQLESGVGGGGADGGGLSGTASSESAGGSPGNIYDKHAAAANIYDAS